MNVYGGTITSSPGSIPIALRVVKSALVPFAVARQVFAPVRLRVGLFESRDVLAIAAIPFAAAQRLGDRALLRLVENGPATETARDAPSRRPAWRACRPAASAASAAPASGAAARKRRRVGFMRFPLSAALHINLSQ